MGEFVEAALDFPTVLFSFLLLVVVGYWVLVLVGAAEVDTDAEPDGEVGGLGGLLAGFGLGGVPAMVVLSLLIALAWFVSLAGTVLLDHAAVSSSLLVALSIVVLGVALACAWLGTRLLVRPLRPPCSQPVRRPPAAPSSAVCVSSAPAG